MKSCRHAFLLSSLLLAANCLTCVVVSTAKAALILNGSFESPIVGLDGYSTTFPTDWTASFGGIVRGVGSGLSPYTAPPQVNGNQYSLNGTGGNSIQQTFTSGAAGDYTLTWVDNGLIDSTPPIQFTHYDVLVFPSALLPANAIAFATEGPFTGSTTWNDRSLSMTLDAAASYVLLFRGYSDADGFYYALDNVSLDATPVPEPPTIIAVALLLLPIGITILKTLRRARTV